MSLPPMVPGCLFSGVATVHGMNFFFKLALFYLPYFFSPISYELLSACIYVWTQLRWLKRWNPSFLILVLVLGLAMQPYPVKTTFLLHFVLHIDFIWLYRTIRDLAPPPSQMIANPFLSHSFSWNNFISGIRLFPLSTNLPAYYGRPDKSHKIVTCYLSVVILTVVSSTIDNGQ